MGAVAAASPLQVAASVRVTPTSPLPPRVRTSRFIWSVAPASTSPTATVTATPTAPPTTTPRRISSSPSWPRKRTRTRTRHADRARTSAAPILPAALLLLLRRCLPSIGPIDPSAPSPPMALSTATTAAAATAMTMTMEFVSSTAAIQRQRQRQRQRRRLGRIEGRPCSLRKNTFVDATPTATRTILVIAKPNRDRRVPSRTQPLLSSNGPSCEDPSIIEKTKKKKKTKN
mmetsp:Transcript_24379/g.48717  ORF Transcript_24379/g.48717 Transcript_24379/m.48717 type:complete len:230 (-) Transcript_24379:700-1389(-)